MAERDENMIAALKRERAVYASRGKSDRVAQVDESLKGYGYDGTQDADPGAPVQPVGRTAGRKQSAEGEAITTKPDGTATPDDKTGGKTEEKAGQQADNKTSSASRAKKTP